jgi:ubiquinone/menaquinone biosynthesis C-methylase UbiE
MMDNKELCVSYYEKAAPAYDATRFDCRCRRFVDVLFKEAILSCVSEKQRILDAGTGTGRFARALAIQGKDVIAMDTSAAMLHEAETKARQEGLERQIEFLAGDIERIPLDDESVDGITCIHVLVHYQDIRRAIAEFSRVLRPGGYLVFEVANHWVARCYHWLWAWRSGRDFFSYPDYYHKFARVEAMMAEQGITIVRTRRIKKIPKFILHVLLCKLRIPGMHRLLTWLEHCNFGSVSVICGEKTG